MPSSPHAGAGNRTRKAGYKVVRILFDPATNRPYGMLTIIDGLDESKNAAAVRPVDCVQMPDGSIIFKRRRPGPPVPTPAAPAK